MTDAAFHLNQFCLDNLIDLNDPYTLYFEKL